MAGRGLRGNGGFVGDTVSLGLGLSVVAVTDLMLRELVNYDDFLSRYLMTNYGRESVLQRL